MVSCSHSYPPLHAPTSLSSSPYSAYFSIGTTHDSDDDDEDDHTSVPRMATRGHGLIVGTGARESKRQTRDSHTNNGSSGATGARATAAEWSRRTRNGASLPSASTTSSSSSISGEEKKRNDPRLLQETWRVRQEMRLIRLLTLRNVMTLYICCLHTCIWS
jgi:hypothetical protein